MADFQPYQQSILNFFKEGEKLNFYPRKTKNNMKTAHFQYKSMKKYRIKQINNTFYPQKRFLGIWWDMENEYGISACDSLSEARKIIASQIERERPAVTIYDYP